MKNINRRDLVVGTWNVRTLVESSGDIRVCRKRQLGVNSDVVDRKLDLLVKEMERYGVSVVGIQESKWFGREVWPVAGGYIFLHSGRPLPASEDMAIRNEGVGILLDGRAAAAWRQAGEVWEAVSSRVITARLKWVGRGQRRNGGSRETSNVFVTVVCVYAPTARAPPGVKEKFSCELQDTLDKVPRNDVLVLLGDFNARVGVLKPDEEEWRGVLGRNGLDERNEAGEDLMQFCALNQMSVMNTWFQKRQVQYGTWTHPATKVSHMIDLVVMRAGQRMCCRDVQVMRGANCWTDHNLVRAKLRLEFPRVQGRGKKKVSPFSVHKFLAPANRDKYRGLLESTLEEHPHRPDLSPEENWETLKSCIVSVAEEAVGRGKRKQPEWFEENVEELGVLIAVKNEAHARMLRTNSVAARKEFRRQQRTVKRAVDKAKEEWIRKVARECETAAKDGRTRWNNIRRLQQVHAGRRPARPTVVRKEGGELTQGSEEVLQRWHQHFSKLLNQCSEFEAQVIQQMPEMSPMLDLDEPPTEDELLAALSKMKRGKAGGKSGILPELVLYGGAILWDWLLELMQAMWRRGEVVADWKNAEVVPIPKKGDLQRCDNWRGISLLDVVGKLFARVIQERLQVIAERVLPDSQCGFRRGRGCCDMIFVARQLLEKAREHNDSLFVLFVDLRKAYDSVPREALWQVLERCGVPPRMLSVVKSLHQGMQAEVRVGSSLSESFEVRNGLRQGCTLAPTLFNIYFSAVVASWKYDCTEAGVDVLFHHGRKLVGDRTAKSRLSVVRVTESQFADDVALYAGSRGSLQSVAEKFVAGASKWGLTVSIPKTKGMALGEGLADEDVAPLVVESGEIEMVEHFTYLGSILSSSGDVMQDVKARIGKASRVFGYLRSAVFGNPTLSIPTKRVVYKATVLAVLLYGAETWTLKAEHVRRLTSFHNRCVRTILGVTRYQQWKERLTSRTLSGRFGMEWSIPDYIMDKRLQWLGHVGRMNEERLPKIMLFGEMRKKRPCHGTKKRWRDMTSGDLQAIGMKEGWYQLCQDKKDWCGRCRKGVDEVASCRRRNTCAANRQAQERFFVCQCGRTFRRQGDLTRHKKFCRGN